MTRWELKKTYKNWRFFPWKKTTKNQLILTGFFTSFFCTVFSFDSFFFKVHLVDNLNKIWFHLFLFTHPSYMELGSWKQEMLTIMKWTQKDTVLKLLLCLTLKLFWRDFHLSLIMTTTATITLHLKTDALMQRKFWCLKRKMKHWFWCVNSSAFPSSGNDNARVARYLFKSKIL